MCPCASVPGRRTPRGYCCMFFLGFVCLRVVRVLMSVVLVFLISCLFCTLQEMFTNLAEIDMVVADLERENIRVATVERRNVHKSVL